MRRALVVAAAIAVVGVLVTTALGAPGRSRHQAAASRVAGGPVSPTERIAGPQHFCATNGVNCSEPALDWDEYSSYDKAVQRGARLQPYIGHDEPSIQFFSSRHGSGNDNTYRLVLPRDPPTLPQQDGSGGNFNFQQRATFWFGMQLCDDEGAPNPDGAALSGHATIPCRPDSDANIFASPDPTSTRYFGLGPGQGFMEMQFYPPGWAPWPAGFGCDGTHWCAALNIDTFQDNENTGDFNNTDCLNTVGPEPVNFDFLTKDGVATAPGNPQHPEHFVPDLARDFLMNPGDHLRLHMSDTAEGFRVTVDDLTRHTRGSMTASAANGFGSVIFDPSATKCQVRLHDYHPMYDTANPAERNFNAAHTGNISFADEIGHFEYCAAVNNDPLSTCSKPLGDDTNNPDNSGQDPLGDDVFCLPASASARIKIGGCTNTDGDFDSVSYKFSWPGSISNPGADFRLNARPIRFTSPTTDGRNFESSAFESDISRDESVDTEFRIETPCQRHIQNPADPHPGVGCVNPPPGSDFHPFYSTIRRSGTCWWQEGGPYIAGTVNRFGGSAQAEYGPLRAISYPAAPFGTVTKRFNDFRSNSTANPCPAS
jgi:hypothetical protein